MLDYLKAQDRDEVFAASLIRMVPVTGDSRVVPALLKSVKDPSPLVRSAAVETLGLNLNTQTPSALIAAAGDETRLVRVKAAAALVGYPRQSPKAEEAKKLEKANTEYLAFIQARPDQWIAHYNMGNYYLNTGNYQSAIASYQAALKREPQAVMALVNSSLAYSRSGDNRQAEEALRKAIKIAPESGAANFNLGLLKAEQKHPKQAERYLRAALKADPQMAPAAYNLCILLSQDRLDEALGFCRQASELRSEDPRYAFTLAYYLNKKGEKDQALKILDKLLEAIPHHRDAQRLREEIAGSRGKP
jgi:tetratricopeptide (TPR) repeat protein